MSSRLLYPLIICLCTSASLAQIPSPPKTLAEARDRTLVPYTGPTNPGVDVSTLNGKVVVGYQGWFNVPDDGAGRGWIHWTKHRGELADGNAKFDLWPDVSELGADERFASGFKLSDGKPAEVFSSFNRQTVLRHFRWMKEYGIDAAFVQRFAGGTRDPGFIFQNNTVLAHCREGANLSGRAYIVMYDLSGLRSEHLDAVMDDWRSLRLRMKITEDHAYLHHRGKPLVAVWGVGFNDKRKYTLDDCRKLIDFFKNDPQAGGCSVMVGAPTYWRELKNDAVPDSQLHDVLASADVLNPWTVGRYGSPEKASAFAHKQLVPDLAWCAEHKVDYLPVVFPGFSWRNMFGQETHAIPRLGGRFLWTQFREAKQAGARAVYVAMFDEVDEGTAIFKCTNDVPIGEQSHFVTYEGLPSDFYLRLAGAGGKMLRGEAPVTDDPPLRSP